MARGVNVNVLFTDFLIFLHVKYFVSLENTPLTLLEFSGPGSDGSDTRS